MRQRSLSGWKLKTAKYKSSVMATRRKRTYNTRLIKATWPYSVQEIAALYKVHKNAPLRWLKEGLEANMDGRPYLIRGDALIRFLNARQKARKHRCKSNEFFCFKCRAPREAYLSIADITMEGSNRFRMKALCAICGARMSKVQGIKKLAEIKNRFNIQKLEGQHLIERSEPSVNSDLENKT